MFGPRTGSGGQTGPATRRLGYSLGGADRDHEAFAAIAIVVARELGLPDDIVNVEGGAVAHGHPIGATGAVLTTKLIHSMRRDGLSAASSRCASAAARASPWRLRQCTENT
jgi:hypothetical protein